MNSNDKQVMIYGANGYTGELIIDHALAQGIRPILAGRNQTAIAALADKHQLPMRVFDLACVSDICGQLHGIDVVIHCAGPFSATAKPMMQACLDTHTHYTDITGEIEIFELAQSLDKAAKKANIVICPGVGFDVIPTDCLASQLKQQMPDATHLALGFDSAASMSPGTTKTSIEALKHGGCIRRDGKLVTVPLAYKNRQIDFGHGLKNAVTIPWGDISTAFYSTGIENIEVYIPLSPRSAKRLHRLNWFRWLLGIDMVQNWMKNKADKTVQGPNARQRQELKTALWGEVRNAGGKTLTARFETANGYELTCLGAVAVCRHLLENNISGGAFTPSQLVDNQLVGRLPGSTGLVFE